MSRLVTDWRDFSRRIAKMTSALPKTAIAGTAGNTTPASSRRTISKLDTWYGARSRRSHWTIYERGNRIEFLSSNEYIMGKLIGRKGIEIVKILEPIMSKMARAKFVTIVLSLWLNVTRDKNEKSIVILKYFEAFYEILQQWIENMNEAVNHKFFHKIDLSLQNSRFWNSIKF